MKERNAHALAHAASLHSISALGRESNQMYYESLSYEELEAAAPPTRPLDFPTPVIHSACWGPMEACDHRSGKVHHIKNALMRESSSNQGNVTSPQCAYLVKKQIRKTSCGSIHIAVRLQQRRYIEKEKDGVPEEGLHWESTEDLVAIKVSSWEKMLQRRGRNLEDPLKEASALQFVGNYHKHILGCIEVLQDIDHLYVVMPYCSGGDLYTEMFGHKNSMDHTNEARARVWFRQLLHSLLHLEKKGMCHRDICLENLLLDSDRNVVLVDFGLALRIPHIDESNYGGISDVSEGFCRRLMTKQGASGKLTYLAPEVVSGDGDFDGQTVDLWACSVVLFVLLVGVAPFEWAHHSDSRFYVINQGRLAELLKSMNIAVSPSACDLLQNLFWSDPRKRLRLSQVLQHSWVVGSQPRSWAMESSSGEMSMSSSLITPPHTCGLLRNTPPPSIRGH